MKAGKQTTLCNEASISGIGVHSGSPVTLTLHPADAGTGIVFLRTGLPGRSDCEIRADVRAVTATEFATVLGDDDGPLCATAEHVLAALAGLGVDNAVVEVDGPEVPIMDGSAEAFVAAINHAGVRTLDARRRYLKVLKPIRVTRDKARGELVPNGNGLRLDVEISFDHPSIGHQRCVIDVTPDTEEWWVQEVIAHRGKTNRNAECTPGYYNFEGEFNRRQDGNYNGGFRQYFEHMTSIRGDLDKHFHFTR